MNDDEPDEAPQPSPFTLEDAAYAAIVSEYAGLQRGGADPVSAALITAAHLFLLGLGNAAGQQENTA